MTLTLYNTLTRTKAPFTPIDPKNVRMYVCGPTVYDFAHIGNARPVIVFDVLFRLLRHIYGADHVTYVRNITDVDDKINARAAERYPDMVPEAGIRKLTEETAAQFHKDIAALGVLPPTHEPRATENIQQMIDIIVALLAKGHAYVAAGEVLFDVRSMKDYGELSNRNLDEQQAGARVEVDAHKKNPGDFVLWKLSEPHEPGWESPWGRGRPGWHIECSAMSARYLGDVFDIHGGGLDLIFPHHENEIAQSRCAHGTPVMAKTWMHNGFLQVEGEKMSKSLGNFVTINELLETTKFGGRKWAGEVLRLAMLKTHYRQPIDWTRSLLHEAKSNYDLFASVRPRFIATTVSDEFFGAISDDLNTKSAIDILLRLANFASLGNAVDGGRLAASLRLFGMLSEDAIVEFPGWAVDQFNIEDASINGLKTVCHGIVSIIPQNATVGQVRHAYLSASSPLPLIVKNQIAVVISHSPTNAPALDYFVDPERALMANTHIAARIDARKAKDFEESDRIRDELAAMGIALKDTKNKETGEIETTWEVAR